MSGLEAVTSLNTTESQRANESRSQFSADFDNFLLILTTQLQNQDPLSPTDTHEFTNQLVLFADVEQSIQQNANLENLISMQSANQAVGALGYIGQTVEVEGDAFNLEENDEDGVNLRYTLEDEADAASISVFNAVGDAVLVQAVEPVFGVNDFNFDGLDGSGDPLPPGVYFFRVNAVDSDDVPIDVKQSVEGRVDGVESDDDGVFLTMGDLSVPIDNILKVREAEAPPVPPL
ncbi:MAG: flagellar hook capping FlgD N-terminal domain-containing protein [Alphaproteobacteria bacterium]|nr:flagellar hook capping FlgD N-terminal domain-containing protein [Alphaproteobacteria bacterium]